MNARGQFCLQPGEAGGDPLPLQDAVAEALRAGAQLPLIIRVPSVLTERASRLRQAFADAFATAAPSASYQPLYPVKVNPSRRVVETLLQAHPAVGLEVGTKAEMMLALHHARTRPIDISVNGTKDADYLDMAVAASRLGSRPTVVLERREDLALLQAAMQRGDLPLPLGVRLKPCAQGSGRWADSGGQDAHFGFDLETLLRTTSELQSSGLMPRMRVLHVHAGSQITSLTSLQGLATEAAAAYVALRQVGWPLCTLNVGGGLAVDYDGQAGTGDTSCDYGVHAYARTFANAVADACQASGEPVPDLQSESGRYLTAHHAMVVADATRKPDDPAHATSRVTAEAWTAHMSLFQSLPDAWALGMVFPALPLEGIHDPLAEHPAVLTDTTCDSDGRLKRYVTGYGPMAGMPMPVTEDGHRRIAFCLTGAYQEVLANAHNLLGRPAEVTVGHQDGRIQVKIDRPAQSVASILKDFGYEAIETAADSVSTYAAVDRPKP